MVGSRPYFPPFSLPPVPLKRLQTCGLSSERPSRGVLQVSLFFFFLCEVFFSPTEFVRSAISSPLLALTAGFVPLSTPSKFFSEDFPPSLTPFSSNLQTLALFLTEPPGFKVLHPIRLVVQKSKPVASTLIHISPCFFFSLELRFFRLEPNSCRDLLSAWCSAGALYLLLFCKLCV